MTDAAPAPVADAPTVESAVVPEGSSATPAPEETAVDSAAAEPTASIVAKRFEAAKQAEVRAQTIAARVRQERAAFEAERKAMAERDVQAKEVIRLLREDPAKALRMAGVEDPMEWIGQVGRPKTELERIAEAEARIEAKLAAKEQELEQRAQTAAQAQAMAAFVRDTTTENAPNLAKLYDPEDIPKLVHVALQEHLPAFVEQYGRAPSDDEVRAYLERDAARRVARLTAAGKPPPADTSAPSLPGTNGTRTLTNNAASVASTARNPSAKTEEERVADVRKWLEAESAERHT